MWKLEEISTYDRGAMAQREKKRRIGAPEGLVRATFGKVDWARGL